MQNPASTFALHPTEAQHLEGAIGEIFTIFSRLYPDHGIRLVLHEGTDPTWGASRVSLDPINFSIANLGPDFIGQVYRKPDRPNASDVTVWATLPPRATPGDQKGLEPSWFAQRFKALFALKPIAYEHVRYLMEMRRKRAVFANHTHRSLARGTGSIALSLSRDTFGDTREKPSIIIGFHWLEVGGAEKLAFDSVKWALSAGLRVFVVASTRSLHRLADRLPDHPDVTFIRLDLYLPDYLWPQFIGRLIESEKVQMVHIHHCQLLYECLPQIKACYPWVKTVDSTHIVEHSDGGYPRVSGVWSNFIDVHHVISRDLSFYYRDIFRVLGKVRLGRMLERHMEDAPRTLPPLNFKSGQKVLHITFVGRLYYQKRPIVVVEALRALSQWAKTAGVTIKGSFVGEGPFEAAVRALLRRYGLLDQIELMPANSNVPALLEKSDILLLPSNNEGLALVCYEAVEKGCLPISTDVGAQREIVPPGLLVPLAPMAAVRQIVAIIDRLWRNPEALQQEQEALHNAWRALEADPTAEEILMPIYRAAAQADNKAEE